MRIKVQYIITCLLLAASLTGYGQVSAKASVDRDKILLGEHIQLTLQVYSPLGETVSWFALDTIPRFEFISRGKIDTTEGVDGKKWEQVLTITSFDSGSISIPPLALTIGNNAYYTDSIPIEISYTAFNPADDYRDIKEIEEVFNPFAKYIPWIITILAVISIGGIVWFLKKKKLAPLEKKAVFSSLSPYEEAMKALGELQKKDVSTLAGTKSYYTEMNDILRVFILRKLNISSLEKTNEELILQLREMGFNKDTFSRLAQALRMSDFVKFAKYQPTEADNKDNFEIIQSAIKTLDRVGGGQ
jgi:hypothetical protein